MMIVYNSLIPLLCLFDERVSSIAQIFFYLKKIIRSVGNYFGEKKSINENRHKVKRQTKRKRFV